MEKLIPLLESDIDADRSALFNAMYQEINDFSTILRNRTTLLDSKDKDLYSRVFLRDTAIIQAQLLLYPINELGDLSLPHIDLSSYTAAYNEMYEALNSTLFEQEKKEYTLYLRTALLYGLSISQESSDDDIDQDDDEPLPVSEHLYSALMETEQYILEDLSNFEKLDLFELYLQTYLIYLQSETNIPHKIKTLSNVINNLIHDAISIMEFELEDDHSNTIIKNKLQFLDLIIESEKTEVRLNPTLLENYEELKLVRETIAAISKQLRPKPTKIPKHQNTPANPPH